MLRSLIRERSLANGLVDGVTASREGIANPHLGEPRNIAIARDQKLYTVRGTESGQSCVKARDLFLEELKSTSVDLFIPAHGEPIRRAGLAQELTQMLTEAL